MKTGKLSVRLESESYFLDSNLPFEVRDAHHRLVEKYTGGSSMQLPAGLYTVEAVLPDGGRASQMVQVEAEGKSTVTFSAKAAPPAEQHASRGMAAGASRGPQTLGFEQLSSGSTSGSTEVALQLQDVNECELAEEGPDGFLFVPTSDPTKSTPWARFSVGMHHRVVVSLPLNPCGGFPENACTVRTFAARGEVTFKTSFHTGRRVATAIQGMLLSGGVLRGANVIAEASNLLLGKYQDPSAAALGGLTLHRLGHLQKRQGWVENLAGDFPWIPDASVLLANLLSDDDDPAERERGYVKLIEASRLRPLYTDGLSLLLETLRRWPDPERATWDERRERLEAISSLASRIDWNALSLTELEEP